MLAGRYPSEDFAGLRPRLVWDRTTGTLHGRPGGQRLAVTNGGHHPRPRPVRRVPGRRSATVRQALAPGRRAGRGDGLRVAGRRRLRARRELVADRGHHRRPGAGLPAPGQPGRLPFWHGDAPGRPAELGAAIGAFCRELGAAGPRTGRPRGCARDGLDELAAANLLAYLAGQREATGYLPDDRTLVVERFRDELGDWRLVLHSPYGARVHAPWALAIAARLRERYGGMDVQALHTDDGIVIRVPGRRRPAAGRHRRARPGRGRAAGDRRAWRVGAVRRPGSGSARPARCCCPGASPAGARRCGSSGSAPRSCWRWPASTPRSRSCWRRCASACRTCSTCPA